MAIRPELLRSWGPGGWQFYQPETNWHAPLPMANTFDQQVDNIIAMRQANPRFHLPTDRPTVAADLEAYTEARWRKNYSKAGMQKFLAGGLESKKKESNFTRSVSRLFGNAAGLVGIDHRSLAEWLGAGAKPVAESLASSRALICAKCECNRKYGWRELLTVPAAAALRQYIESKNRMRLATAFDNDLGSCSACHCVLELKVWQPAEFIKENTTPETLLKHSQCNPKCWAVSETST